MHMSKIPPYYMYCLICLMGTVAQAVKYLTLKNYPKFLIFLVAAAITFFDAYKVRWKLNDEN